MNRGTKPLEPIVNLNQYLLHIKNNQPINFERFVTLLPREVKADWHRLFESKKLAVKKYRVTVLDAVAFSQLLADSAPVETRVAAAKQGDSHKVGTSCSFLLVYHASLPDARPDVVLINDEEILQSFTAKKQLLIIENEENFFRYREMLPLLSALSGTPLDLTYCDIVLGGGNQITKKLNFAFFEQYHSVFCAFDLDVGGLHMFDTLQKRLGERVRLLMPTNFSAYSGYFVKKPDSNEQWQKALDLSLRLGFVELYRVFARERRFMEQETLLR